MRVRRPIVALLAASVLPPAAAFAARVEIACGRDATLFSSCGCYADGAGPALYSGQTRFYGARRALLWFGIADSIPSGSRIDSVQLRLQVEQVASGPETHALHRVTARWGEGSTLGSGGGGLPAAPGDVTWTHRVYATVAWNTPGGDFEPVASAVASVGDVGPARWASTSGMVADVQAWLDLPVDNFGWILIGNESAAQTAKRLTSRDGPAAGHRPVLIVDFTPPLAVKGRPWAAIKRLYGPSNRQVER